MLLAWFSGLSEGECAKVMLVYNVYVRYFWSSRQSFSWVQDTSWTSSLSTVNFILLGKSNSDARPSKGLLWPEVEGLALLIAV